MSNKFKQGNRRGRPPKYSDPEELISQIEAYFDSLQNETEAEDRKPTVTGLSLFLGFKSKQSLYNYEQRSEELGYIIRRALTVIENYHEKMLGTQYSSGHIFALKNMNWSDKQEIAYSDRDNADEVDLSKLSTEELRQWKSLTEKASIKPNGEADAEPAMAN